MFSNCLSPFAAAVLNTMTEATYGRKELICLYSSREPGVHDGGVELQRQKQEDRARACILNCQQEAERVKEKWLLTVKTCPQ